MWLGTESGGEGCRRRHRSGPRPDCAEPRGRIMVCSGFDSGPHGTLCVTRASLWPCRLQEQAWKQVEGYSVVSQGMVEHTWSQVIGSGTEKKWTYLRAF